MTTPDPQRDNRKLAAILIASLIGLLLFASIATPNLLRSRMAADQASRWGKMREAFDAVQAAERKLTRTANISLLVDDLKKATDAIRTGAESLDGEFTNSSSSSDQTSELDSVTLQVRVPAARLDDFLALLKNKGWRVERESVETVDVTMQYVDTEAKLNNLKAVEQQYLTLLKQARSVQDTLNITGKLNETRTNIDATQGEMNVMKQQVATSLVKISLSRDAEARIFGIYWRPLANMKRSVHDLLSGLTTYADMMVFFLLQLPLYVLWLVTVLVGIIAAIRICLATVRFFADRGWFSAPKTSNA